MTDLRLWDTSKEDAGVRLLGHESPVRCLVLAPDGKTAPTGSGKAHRESGHSRTGLGPGKSNGRRQAEPASEKRYRRRR